jgi:FAD:protein FMN transferase
MESKCSMQAFGTTATVAVTDAQALQHATLLLASEIEEMDRAASRFRPDSEVSALSRAGGSPLRVSPLMFESVLVALSVAQWTDGAVDPTVGRLMEDLGYDRDFAGMAGVAELPRYVQQSERVDARNRRQAGWRSVEVDFSKRTVRVPDGVLLDLGASAKALAADRAAASIARRTRTGVLVSIGGDISVAGPPPDRGWAIGIAQSSSTPADSVDQVVAITSGGLASSSTTIRSWNRSGRVVHHIIDPQTGDCARECWNLVSVAASSCVEANAASTAAIVWGPSAPKRLTMARLPARFVSVAGDVSVVCGWPDAPAGRGVPQRAAS